jgi:annexin A7/11
MDYGNPHEDAEILRSSMKGKTKNEEKIIKIITNRTNEQRQQIKTEYNKLYNSDLIKDLQKELSGHFEDVVVALFYHPIDYDCFQLRKAVKGLGTDEDALIEILATRTPQEIEQIKQRYSEMYPGRSLVKDVESDTSGNFRKILVALLEAKRPDNSSYQVEQEEIERCAKLLLAEDNKKLDIDVYIKIFTEKSQADFIRIAQAYFKFTRKTILQTVEKQFSGDCKEALIGIIYAMISPAEYFAKKVYKAVKGLGTDNNTLIRILITRDEKDMPQIKQFFKHLYKKDMLDAVKGDTSGNYQKILYELASH